MIKKKVGVIVDSTLASKQLHDLINLSLTSESYAVTTLIVQNPQHYQGPITHRIYKYIQRRGFQKFLANACFRILCKFESIFVKRSSKFAYFFDKYDLSKFNLDVIEITPTVSSSGLVYRYDENELQKIKTLGLNLLIRYGSGILRGGILTTCPNGVISFHHADNDINRGGPPGFWEVFNKEPRTGFIIQRLKDELDGGDVLFKGFVPTSWMYSLNLAKLYEISNPFFHYVLEDITAESSKLAVKEKKPYSYPLYTTPTVIQQLGYVFKTSCHLAGKLIRKITSKSHRWGVAYQFTENWKDVALWRSKKIPNPKNRFLADPFLIKRNGKHYCFVEDFDYATASGSISVYEITKNGSKEIGVALAEDFHLSYPYLFEFDGNLYMCPETHESRDIRVYKAVEFPLRWELEKILMRDISAADTNIFKKDGKWWLISNISTNHIDNHASELHVFYSDSPLSDTWKPHPKNPVIFDPLTARNGGFIREDANLYRVYQRQGFDMYGKALGVSKVTQLDLQNYEEDSLFEVEANFFKEAIGVHTYNYSEGLLVFDYVEISSYKKGV